MTYILTANTLKYFTLNPIKFMLDCDPQYGNINSNYRTYKCNVIDGIIGEIIHNPAIRLDRTQNN